MSALNYLYGIGFSDMDWSKLSLNHIAVVIGFLINISVLVWQAAKIDSSVVSLEAAITALQIEVSSNAASIGRLNTDVAVIQANRFTATDAIKLMEMIAELEKRLR